MDRYLTGRKALKRVYVVIDARHGLKQPDREMLAFLSKYGGVSYAVVLNKTDLVKPADLARRAFLIKEELRAAKRARAEVWMASTSTGAGVAEFGAELLGLAAACAPGEEGESGPRRLLAARRRRRRAGDARVFSTKARRRGRGASWTSGGEDDDEPSGGGGRRRVDPGPAQCAEKGRKEGKGRSGARTVARRRALIHSLFRRSPPETAVPESSLWPSARFPRTFSSRRRGPVTSPPHSRAPTSPLDRSLARLHRPRLRRRGAGAMTTSAGFGPRSGLGCPSHWRRGASRLARAREVRVARVRATSEAPWWRTSAEVPPEIDLEHAVILELTTCVTRALPALGGARPRGDVTASSIRQHGRGDARGAGGRSRSAERGA